MAIKLSANYSKKLGLPQYSSHSFSASVEVELNDLSQAEAEIQKLYELLQHAVDQEIQHPGFVPAAESNGHHPAANGRSYAINNSASQSRTQPTRVVVDRWNCTDGQKGFIQRILNENHLQMQDAEDLSQQLFGTGVKQLNKMQASQLIDDLLTKAGKPARQSRWQQRPAATTTPTS
jgi:hypothetical protein